MFAWFALDLTLFLWPVRWFLNPLKTWNYFLHSFKNPSALIVFPWLGHLLNILMIYVSHVDISRYKDVLMIFCCILFTRGEYKAGKIQSIEHMDSFQPFKWFSLWWITGFCCWPLVRPFPDFRVISSVSNNILNNLSSKISRWYFWFGVF